MTNKTKTIKSFDDEKIKTECLGCAMNSGILDFSRGEIIKTKYFNAHQDFEIPISGFIIIASKRHVDSIQEFSKEELFELAELMQKTRICMKRVLKIQKIFIFQNENSEHHFHIWLFPRYKWMNKFGNKMSSIPKIIKHAKQNMKNSREISQIKKSVEKLRAEIKKI